MLVKTVKNTVLTTNINSKIFRKISTKAGLAVVPTIRCFCDCICISIYRIAKL